MTKCDFCRDELEAGGIPACVAACPTRALTFGEFDGLRPEMSPSAQSAMAPLPNRELTVPRAVFKPHRRSRPAGSTAGYIANPEENSDV